MFWEKLFITAIAFIDIIGHSCDVFVRIKERDNENAQFITICLNLEDIYIFVANCNYDEEHSNVSMIKFMFMIQYSNSFDYIR